MIVRSLVNILETCPYYYDVISSFTENLFHQIEVSDLIGSLIVYYFRYLLDELSALDLCPIFDYHGFGQSLRLCHHLQAPLDLLIDLYLFIITILHFKELISTYSPQYYICMFISLVNFSVIKFRWSIMFCSTF